MYKHEHGEDNEVQTCQGFGQALVVARQSPEPVEPAEAALNHPAAGQQYKALLRLGQFDDLQLPQELGVGSGMTCWRRLRDWQAAGVWDKLHLAMLRRLREHDQIDWGRASVDAASVASPRGGRKPVPTRRTGASSGRNDTSSQM